MMNKIFFVLGSYFLLQSCVHNNSGQQVVKTGVDSIVLQEKVPIQEPGNDISVKILGTWALAGEENASFVIEKQQIVYPETFTSYKYSLLNDSIRIKYEDYTGSYLIKMKGLDTLILRGDEEQRYFRFKK